jgi:hypothetical protein
MIGSSGLERRADFEIEIRLGVAPFTGFYHALGQTLQLVIYKYDRRYQEHISKIFLAAALEPKV